MAKPSEYDLRAALAIEAILNEHLLNEHHAEVQPELDARISEGEFMGSPQNINPTT